MGISNHSPVDENLSVPFLSDYGKLGLMTTVSKF